MAMSRPLSNVAGTPPAKRHTGRAAVSALVRGALELLLATALALVLGASIVLALALAPVLAPALRALNRGLARPQADWRP